MSGQSASKATMRKPFSSMSRRVRLGARNIKVVRAVRSFADENELRFTSEFDQSVVIGGGRNAVRSLRDDARLVAQRESAHGPASPPPATLFDAAAA